MAIGVVLKNEEKCALKSCPPDGYVIIRRMDYGESLKRKDMMASMAMELNDKKGANTEETMKLQMKILQGDISIWEFSNLIIDHNITDEKENKLDFKNPNHVKMLRGPVGDEIQMHIDKLNSFEDDHEVKN